MKFEYYQDSKGEWRWRLKSMNGNVLADSAEGYVEKADMLHTLKVIQLNAKIAQVVEAK